MQDRNRNRLVAVISVAALVVGLLVVALLEGDLPEAWGALAEAIGDIAPSRGPAGALGVLYLEESGIPSLVPGDVFVVYLGSSAAHNIGLLILYWLAAIAVVGLGSSNLYWLSKRFGHRLVAGRLGRLIHVTPERLERAEDWFARRGALAIIFGRHVPGLRIPITVAAGILEVPYRVFLPSVAVSSAIWAGLWLLLGYRYGRHVTDFVHSHRINYVLVGAVIAFAVVLYVIVARRRRHSGPVAEP